VLVVIDANVFVSAAIQRGASHRIIESWQSGAADFEAVMSPDLLGEIREVLTNRPRLRKSISLETATLFVDTIEMLVDLVDDPDEVQTETRDPNDGYLITLARTHEADVIVSGDKDLLEWEPQSPPVVTPAQFAVIRSDDVNEPLVTAQAAHCTFPIGGDRSRRKFSADQSVAVRAWGLGRCSLRLAGRVPLPVCVRLGGERCGAPGCAAGGDTCGVSERSAVLPGRDDLRRLGLDIDGSFMRADGHWCSLGLAMAVRVAVKLTDARVADRSSVEPSANSTPLAAGFLRRAGSGRRARCRRSRPRLAVELFADRLTLAAMTIFDEQWRGDVRKTGL